MKSSATSVKTLRENGDPAEAAIASAEAARLNGMEVLKSGIETNPRNFTRFVVISTEPLENGDPDKSSLVFSTPNEPGALFSALKVFAETGVNLTKLESRPIHGRPWEYMFYVDVEVSHDIDLFNESIEELRKATDDLRVLGLYKV